MIPAPARDVDATAFEDLGRATLQIVHDLKNQLNGLKLYATFLRKRLERDDQAREERETLLKLIAGLDRAAKEMTALVRYARPMDLRPLACRTPLDHSGGRRRGGRARHGWTRTSAHCFNYHDRRTPRRFRLSGNDGSD